jgi:hypothetical protein
MKKTSSTSYHKTYDYWVARAHEKTSSTSYHKTYDYWVAYIQTLQGYSHFAGYYDYWVACTGLGNYLWPMGMTPCIISVPISFVGIRTLLTKLA